MGTVGRDGRYRVLLELGEGGTAEVLLAVACGMSGFSKLVVLKMPKRICAHDPDFRQMFLNEARLSARLNHANIVQTNEIIEEDGRPIIVMEYLDGQPLSKILSVGRATLPLAMHLQILVHALSGLHHAHELEDFDGTKLNVVHRDMTPHNIFVTYDGHVKILDFGIAKLDGSEYHTETGVIKGKFRYMAPEQMAGETLDRRADLYAVGVMLWEAAAGERMWKDLADPAMMERVLNGEVSSPRKMNPDVPAELERICMKALATQREERYATAAQLVADLEAVIDDLGTKVTHRELEKFVSHLFESERAAAKKAIEAQHKKVTSLSWSNELDVDEEVRSASGIHSLDTRSSTTAIDPRASRSKSRFVLASIGIACAIAAASLLSVTTKRAPPKGAPSHLAVRPPAAPASPARPPSAVEPAPSEVVDVRISASPATAVLFFDGQALATNPFVAKMTKDGASHRVRAEAHGYLAADRNIVLDSDADLVFTLERIKARAHQPLAPHQQSTEASSNVSTASKPAINCNPPYVFDDQGIKKFKPECL